MIYMMEICCMQFTFAFYILSFGRHLYLRFILSMVHICRSTTANTILYSVSFSWLFGLGCYNHNHQCLLLMLLTLSIAAFKYMNQCWSAFVTWIICLLVCSKWKEILRFLRVICTYCSYTPIFLLTGNTRPIIENLFLVLTQHCFI